MSPQKKDQEEGVSKKEKSKWNGKTSDMNQGTTEGTGGRESHRERVTPEGLCRGKVRKKKDIKKKKEGQATDSTKGIAEISGRRAQNAVTIHVLEEEVCGNELQRQKKGGPTDGVYELGGGGKSSPGGETELERKK